MQTDLVLSLEKKGFLRKSPRILVREPIASKNTTAGAWGDPPAGLWGSQSGYAQGNIDTEALTAWLESRLGDSIRTLIDELYPQEPEDRLRVLVTASDELLGNMMTVPWELMELAGIRRALPFGERLSVVRVLSTQIPPAEPTIVGDRIKVAVTWANPNNDIPDLTEHLSNIRRIVTDYPGELTLVGPLEFTSVKAIRDALIDEHPNVFYHIGHAFQHDEQKVKLLLGPLGAPITAVLHRS